MPAKITEKAVKDRIKQILDPYVAFSQIYTFCPMTFGYGASGHPDRIIVAGGKFLGVEVKKDDNNYHFKPHLKPKPNEAMQARQKADIERAGGEWVCIHSGNLKVLVDWLKANAPAIPPHKQEFVEKLTVL